MMENSQYPCLKSELFGKPFPFFTQNKNLGETYLQCEIYSPCLDPEGFPAFSLRTLKEKRAKGSPSRLLSYTVPPGFDKKQGKEVDKLANLLRREDPMIWVSKSLDFPLITVGDTDSLYKATIISIRDALRWQRYDFNPGNKVDVLVSKDKFAIFEIKGDRDEIWINPVSVHYLTDVELINPIKADLSKLDYPKEHWSGKTRTSLLNRALKYLEWSSFSKRI